MTAIDATALVLSLAALLVAIASVILTLDKNKQ